jgi:hypothetical protein
MFLQFASEANRDAVIQDLVKRKILTPSKPTAAFRLPDFFVKAWGTIQRDSYDYTLRNGLVAQVETNVLSKRAVQYAELQDKLRQLPEALQRDFTGSSGPGDTFRLHAMPNRVRQFADELVRRSILRHDLADGKYYYEDVPVEIVPHDPFQTT